MAFGHCQAHLLIWSKLLRGYTYLKERGCHSVPWGAAEQRDPYGVTEPRVCHAAGISLGQRGGAERLLRNDRLTEFSAAKDRQSTIQNSNLR